MWVIAARRVRPPERTFTAVRAMAPVAGMPPNRGAMTLASPWPNSSRLGLCGAASLMPSATLAERRLSSPASSATANAGRHQLTELQSSEARQRRGGEAPREIADARRVETGHAGEHRREDHCQQRSWDWRDAVAAPTMIAATVSTSSNDDQLPSPRHASPTAARRRRRCSRRRVWAHRARWGPVAGR